MTSVIAIVFALPVSLGLALLLNEVQVRLVAQSADRARRSARRHPERRLRSVGHLRDGAVPEQVRSSRFLARRWASCPFSASLFQPTPSAGNMLNAGIILAVMVIPIITAVSREVIAIVPRDLREAALAMGATRYETIKMAVLPYARNGIVGATMLGLGRALGETIAVAMLIGNGLGINGVAARAGLHHPGRHRQ